MWLRLTVDETDAHPGGRGGQRQDALCDVPDRGAQLHPVGRACRSRPASCGRRRTRSAARSAAPICGNCCSRWRPPRSRPSIRPRLGGRWRPRARRIESRGSDAFDKRITEKWGGGNKILNTCLAYDEKGPLVKRRWPHLYIGPDRMPAGSDKAGWRRRRRARGDGSGPGGGLSWREAGQAACMVGGRQGRWLVGVSILKMKAAGVDVIPLQNTVFIIGPTGRLCYSIGLIRAAVLESLSEPGNAHCLWKRFQGCCHVNNGSLSVFGDGDRVNFHRRFRKEARILHRRPNVSLVVRHGGAIFQINRLKYRQAGSSR